MKAICRNMQRSISAKGENGELKCDGGKVLEHWAKGNNEYLFFN